MRHKKLKLIALLLLVPGLTGLQAQTMYVKESNGIQTAYTLSNIQKMSFSSGNLTVTKIDNSSKVFALSDLRNLNFSDISQAIHEDLFVQSQMLNVYPNPVSDKLNIDLTGSAKTEGTLHILNLEGKTLISLQVSNEGILSFDVSQWPTGIYLCRYATTIETKTVKIMKQ